MKIDRAAIESLIAELRRKSPLEDRAAVALAHMLEALNKPYASEFDRLMK